MLASPMCQPSVAAPLGCGSGMRGHWQSKNSVLLECVFPPTRFHTAGGSYWRGCRFRPAVSKDQAVAKGVPVGGFFSKKILRVMLTTDKTSQNIAESVKADGVSASTSTFLAGNKKRVDPSDPRPCQNDRTVGAVTGCTCSGGRLSRKGRSSFPLCRFHCVDPSKDQKLHCDDEIPLFRRHVGFSNPRLMADCCLIARQRGWAARNRHDALPSVSFL
ncbi:hypothetical protein Pla52n_33330 [Stieleria varia]|uniref:Uncharacterized protein n=1 Tax=Stieleria varia TaxID=2528005 RepID=A0A5C6AQF6_9BACT|nr:hypothetical protein Pla52n_33330 [Stieleria varia]